MTFGTLVTICMQKYMPTLPPEKATLCIDVTIWAGEVQRTQLAISTILTSKLVPLGFFQVF